MREERGKDPAAVARDAVQKRRAAEREGDVSQLQQGRHMNRFRRGVVALNGKRD
jgi:hypothetical protein